MLEYLCYHKHWIFQFYLYSKFLCECIDTSLYYCTFANTWSNIIDSVLALAKKRQKVGGDNKDGEKGIAIFIHSIAVIT